MIYHDLAGWLMMPMALAMLWGVLKFLANLMIEEPEATSVPLAGLTLGMRKLPLEAKPQAAK